MTTQYSTIEAWRRDVPEEDRRITGAAVGTMPTFPATMKELRAKVTNSAASAVGYKHCAHEDRVVVLMYYPAAAQTPPCYMQFPKTMVVGKIIDRVCAMLSLKVEGYQTTRLVRLATHETLPFNAELQHVAPAVAAREEVVLCVGEVLPEVYPAAKRRAGVGRGTGGEGAAEAPADVDDATGGPVGDETADGDDAAAAADGDDDEASSLPHVLPGSPGEPPIAALAATKFVNKKFQPKGAPGVPEDKKIQVAAFIHLPPAQQAIYMYLHRDWVAGRCLDHILQTASIRNPNTTATDANDKAVLYSLRTREPVPSSTPLHASVLQSGDPVLIARAGGLPKWCYLESVRHTDPPAEFAKEARKNARNCVVM